MTLLWLLASLAHADCPDGSTTSAEVSSALERSRDRFAEVDSEGFKAEAKSAFDGLPCVSDVLTRPIVADLHRAAGLVAFTKNKPDASMRAFAASRVIEPDFSFPRSVVPAAHPLRKEFSAIDVRNVDTETVPPAKDGRLHFDGRAANARPTTLPTLFQHVADGGEVLSTAYLRPTDPLPEYAAGRIKSPWETPLIVTSVASLALGGGLLTGAALSASSWQDLDTSTALGQEKLEPLAAQTNTLLVSGSVLLGLGVVTGGTAAAVIVW